MSPRPKRHRRMKQPPGFRGFKPFGCPDENNSNISLLFEEYEAIKLADYEGLTQVEAAERMNVSRPTFTRIYESARKKIAKAFFEMGNILIEGGNFDFEENWFLCLSCNTRFMQKKGEEPVKKCPVCKSENIEQIIPGKINLAKNEISEKRKINTTDQLFCICPKCLIKIQHKPGHPCRNQICPDCGVSMVRENSPHYHAILKKLNK